MRKFLPTYPRIIVAGFFILILLGSLLLMLPIASRTGTWTDYSDCLFTATSATCVTGLIVADTYTHWSLFGQLVILSLIQIGGLGFMTVITSISIFLRRHISLHERRLLMQSAGTMRSSGVIRLLKEILAITFTCEGIGALLLSIRFIPEMGLLKGIYYAIFHAVSAFCNAGFDLMGVYGQYSSLTPFSSDVYVNLIICALIIAGGLGFIVWEDILRKDVHPNTYQLHTKIVIITTAILIVVPTILIFLFESNNSFSQMSFGDKALASFFQTVTARTAGFNTVPLDRLTNSSVLIMMFLMLVGGSPGSTAGGIKTTSLAVLVINFFSCARKKNDAVIFGRRIDKAIIRQTAALVAVYMSAIFAAALIMCAVEQIDFKIIMFEIISAIGTVGVTMGITGDLCGISKLILILLMFFGRIGGLSLMLIFAEKRVNVPIKQPAENVLVG